VRPPGEELGPSQLLYQATSLARQVVAPDVVHLPQTATSRQLRHIDRQQATIDAQDSLARAASEAEYALLPVLINGIEIPIHIPIARLRAILGVPAFDLYPRHSPSLDGPPIASNMDDIDHADTEDEGIAEYNVFDSDSEMAPLTI